MGFILPVEWVDLLVRGALAVTSDGPLPLNIGIRDGTIAYLGINSRSIRAAEVIDADGLLAFPGFVDGHVHFRDPGYLAKEDFATGSLAAACGGITTVVDMPNTLPPPKDLATFASKLACIAPRAVVDFAVTALLGKGSAACIDDLVVAGAIGFNVFNGVTIGNVEAPDSGELLELMRLVGPTGLSLGLLPEDQDIVAAARCAHSTTGIDAWLDAREKVAEATAIAEYLALAVGSACRVHINHLSTADGVSMIHQAKRHGVAVTSETSPHYLLRTREVVRNMGSLARVSPPLREDNDCTALWSAVVSGDVDMVVSDHAPHTDADRDRADLWNPSVTGFSGVELLVPTMFTAATQRGVPFERLARLMSEAPARHFGLYPHKGCLDIGADGDLTLVDPTAEQVVEPSRLRSKSHLTPFAGERLRGWPRYTILRGRTIFAEGECLGRPGDGHFIRGPHSL